MEMENVGSESAVKDGLNDAKADDNVKVVGNGDKKKRGKKNRKEELENLKREVEMVRGSFSHSISL